MVRKLKYTDVTWAGVYVCVSLYCVFLPAANGEEFVSVLTELLFELHVAATPDKLNKVTLSLTHTHTHIIITMIVRTFIGIIHF